MAGFDDFAPEARALGRVDMERIRATTRHEIEAQMIEDGEDPSAPFAVTTHGVRCLAERRQAPIVPSTVLNVLAPEVMRAVATTVRTAASPLADHMAR